jgi:hypothetical protein
MRRANTSMMKGDVDEAAPRRNVGEVRDPEPVRRRGFEVPVDLVERARRRFVAERRAVRLAANDADDPHCFHQPFDGAAGDVKAFPQHLAPDLADAVDAEVLVEHPKDLRLRFRVAADARRRVLGATPPRSRRMKRRWGDRQDPADRLDPVIIAMTVDEGDHGLNRRSSSA